MTVQLPISYQTLVSLVEQLPAEQQQDLLHRLQEKAKQQALSKQEWSALFDSIKIDTPIGEGFSLDRKDWYDDESL